MEILIFLLDLSIVTFLILGIKERNVPFDCSILEARHSFSHDGSGGSRVLNMPEEVNWTGSFMT